MPLLPFDSLVIDSPLSVPEARARLAAATGPRRLLRFSRPEHPFEGDGASVEFRIQRAIQYSNSFLPRLRGRIESGPLGSRLQASLAPRPGVIAFMVVWFTLLFIIGFPTTVAAVRTGGGGAELYVPPLMFFFGWALASGGFTYEARRARAELAALLQGEAADAGRR